jgi:hypothetical protein
MDQIIRTVAIKFTVSVIVMVTAMTKVRVIVKTGMVRCWMSNRVIKPDI